MQVLIGCDPEVFVFNTVNSKFISGEGLVPGSKHKPFKVEKGAIQVDGMALEFNIDPAKTCVEFVGNVTHVFDLLASRVKTLGKDYEITATPVADFDIEVFNSASDEAKVLGCDPDYNAYTGDINEPPDGSVTFRTGSGHVHVGWTSAKDVYDGSFYNQCRRVVKQLDVFLGLPSILWDNDTRRRSLYGALGSFRPKPYGVEYRVLSNAWLQDKHLIAYVYEQSRKAMDALELGNYLPDRMGEDMIKTMFNRPRFLAEGLAEYGITLPPTFLN